VSGDGLVIRNCRGIDELRACVALQKEVWNFSDAELVPLRMFVVAEKVGGQVMGAFEGDRMVGFALSIPGSRSGRLYLHSHMLAVRKDYRNHGLGRRLKLFQREDALTRGIELIEWTFDPLEIKNAYLNIEKLGAIARRYNINQYGITSSPLQGGLPSDRLIAEWWLKSKRVKTLLKTGKHPEFEPETAIDVPAQIYEWKAAAETREKAKSVQERNRKEFLQRFSDGLAVLGYESDAAGNGKFLLARWDEKWSYASQQ
jgi:predicted GNAT superfamily acetyltransferase